MKGLEDFSELLNQLEDFKLAKLDDEGNTIIVDFTLNSPATEEGIKEVELRLGCRLPKEYKEFLKICNGARIFDYDGLDGFIILGTDDIENANRFVSNTFEGEWRDKLLIFAKYIGESNYLAFEIADDNTKYAVIDCFFDELPENWKVISQNFSDFLSDIIKNQGDKFWLK